MKFLVDLTLEKSHAWAGRETLVNLGRDWKSVPMANSHKGMDCSGDHAIMAGVANERSLAIDPHPPTIHSSLLFLLPFFSTYYTINFFKK